MAEEPIPEPGSGPISSASNGGRSIEECQSMIQRSLRTPIVKFLREHLEKSGCVLGDKFIKAVHCNKQISGGYVRGEGRGVCQCGGTFLILRLFFLSMKECVSIVDKQIRAGHLSGDCHYKRELLRGYMKLRGHEQDCVRRRVMKSVIANPYCSEAAAKDAMEAVWDICYNDTQPFDRAP
nr:mitochondrial inner membrane protease atp23 [Quercus suber]